MRKYLAVFIVMAMLSTQVFAIKGYANSADLKSFAMELEELDDSDRATLLGATWDFVIPKINDGTSITESDIDALYSEVQIQLANLGKWDSIVVENSTPGDGKVDPYTIELFIQKLIENKDIVVETFNSMNEIIDGDSKASIRGYLGLAPSATKGDIYAAMYSKKVEMLTYDDTNKFSAIEDAGLDLTDTLNATENEKLGFGYLIQDKLEKLASRVNDKLIDEPSLNAQDIIGVMDAFGIYGVVTPTFTPTPTKKKSGGGGGGGVIPDSSSGNTGTNTNTSDSNAIVNTLNDAQSKIANTTTTEAAITILKDTLSAITTAKSDVANSQQVVNSILATAKAVMSKVSTQDIVATVDGNKATAQISEATLTSMIAKIADVAKTAEQINSILKEDGLDFKVPSILEIKVQGATAADNCDVDIPKEVFDAAATNKIDGISIDTGVAKVQFPTDSIKLNAGEKVKLSAAKVDASTLSEDVKKKVGNAQVYDFSMKVGDNLISKFDKSVKVTIPYELGPGEDKEKVTVFLIVENGADKGKLKNIVGKYDENTKTISFSTNHFSKYFTQVNNVSFDDIADYAWAKTSIEVMASKGVISGMEEGKFVPAENVTRAQFAALIVRQLNLTDETAESNFADVNKEDWFYKEVASAVKAGIIKGRPDGTFAPNENISRQDITVIVGNVLTLFQGRVLPENAKVLDKFNDKDTISAYATNYVALASKNGIISGKPGDLMDPLANATRAESAAIVYRLFNLQ